MAARHAHFYFTTELLIRLVEGDLHVVIPELFLGLQNSSCCSRNDPGKHLGTNANLWSVADSTL